MAHVEAQVEDERKKVAKLEGELMKQQADLKSAEGKIRQQFHEQEGLLNRLSKSQNSFEQLVVQVLGTDQHLSTVYAGLILLVLALILFLS